MLRRLRVLLVEDDARIRALITDILGVGAIVEGAASVEDSARLLDAPRRRFDIVIVDCLLPGREGRALPDGLDLIRTLRREHPNLPVLAITGATEPASLVVDAFRHGARDVLRKPFGVDELRAAVTRLTVRTRRRMAARSPAARAGVARVLSFLAEHAEQPASLDALARVAAMSRSHLSRTFRQAVGVSLRGYVRNLRLERAQRRLVTAPRGSLTDIALDAGFYDLPHFDKAFRERFGISPSEFRRRRDLARAEAARKAARRRA